MRNIVLFENFNPPYESSDSRFDLLKEVFENLDIEYDLDIEFHKLSPSREGERTWMTFYRVYLSFHKYPDKSFEDRIIELVNMAKNYANLDFSSLIIGKRSMTLMQTYNITDIKDRLYTSGGEQIFRLKDLDRFGITFYSIDDADPFQTLRSP